jgi:Fe-S-cluster-containing dehydrogenase component/anaerobic selenocysteine-containing dehydrogenase
MPPLMPDADRRILLKLLASALAVTMAGCSRPEEEIIPYADMPEGLVAGEPLHFATTLPLSGYGRGFLATSIDGRPIKIEGNPSHPFSLGATDVFAEAEVFSLYDPDRSKVVLHKDQIATWDDLMAFWTRVLVSARVGLVTGRIVSPTTLARIDALRARYANLRWYRYEPVNDDAERAGARLSFGKVVTALPDWSRADAVLCLDADPLGQGPDQLRIARAHGKRRAKDARGRLHVAEAAWSLTGAAADFRQPLAPHLMMAMAARIANHLGVNLENPALPDTAQTFADRAAKDLLAARGRAMVLAGAGQPPELHALCHWINGKLAAPITYRASIDPVEEDHAHALSQLADDLRGHKLDALIVLDANPVYDAPDAWDMEKAIASVPDSLHIGLHQDETAMACAWHAPLSHALESWGDARALDGTASITQPLIRPLYDTRTRDELLALLADEPVTKGYDLVRANRTSHAKGPFEDWWRQILHDGMIADTAADPVTLADARLPTLPPPSHATGLTLVLSPHPALRDGRMANNPWLQECPAPFTKQVWGNALGLAPEDAARLGISHGDSVTLTVAGQTLHAPAVIIPAQAEGVIASHWGHGRTQAGRIGNGLGTRWIGLGAKAFPRHLTNVRLEKGGPAVAFRSTQNITTLSGRAEELFQIVDAANANRATPKKAPPSLLPKPARGDYAWAMVIDTDACIGCNACVIACQAENNVPVVGPEEISQGRDMHWLRVDSYARPTGGEERRGFQPVPCMHCELAPCEPVCPVEASVHDHEGLNVQVYNRCIGTRFCEANCPYKVRRFNWFDYAGAQAYEGEGDALKAQHNPDVSARGRGVMEKCNYCLQRVSRARKTAEKEGRAIKEGEMVTACQAACPTRAIHFGDLNRTDSEVSRLREEPRHYTLLEELNTRPRTTYLKRVYADEKST